MDGTRIGFIGAGRLATALATALASAGAHVVAVSDRQSARAADLARRIPGCEPSDSNQAVANAATLIFLAVPDDFIAEAAMGITWAPGQSVVHCSGVRSVGLLDPIAAKGVHTGCFHPFISLGHPVANPFDGGVIGCEADSALTGILDTLATLLGAKLLPLAGVDRAAYHLAGVFASNYLVTLVAVARQLWKDAGLQDDLAARALGTLAASVARALQNGEPATALTGPIARGDDGTVTRHLTWLREHAPDLATLYRDLGLRTVDLAQADGLLDTTRADAIRVLLR